MKIPLVDLLVQHNNLKKEIEGAISKVIQQTEFINGKENKLFEKEFASYCGSKYAIGVASGSAALDLSLEALGIGKGDEVICPSHTFAATAEAIIHRGAKPVFVDIDEGTYNIDPKLIEKKITKRSKAIMVVHLYGQPADIDNIREITQKYDLFLIEDAAQAHGAMYKGKKVGSFGEVACFSFFPAKNLGCYGDGGAVITSDENLMKKIACLKDHGRVGKYEHVQVGCGERLDNLQAAILRVKLNKLDDWNQKRIKIARAYDKALSGKYVVPKNQKDSKAVYYVYTLRHKNRERIQKKLEKKGISTGVYYPTPLHLQKAFAYLNYKKGDLPITEKVCSEIFSVPIFPFLNNKQLKYIIHNLLIATSQISNQ